LGTKKGKVMEVWGREKNRPLPPVLGSGGGGGRGEERTSEEKKIVWVMLSKEKTGKKKRGGDRTICGDEKDRVHKPKEKCSFKGKKKIREKKKKNVQTDARKKKWGHKIRTLGGEKKV